MNFIGNLIWLIFGGLFAALGYLFGGIVLCITVVGIPFGLQCFKLAGLVLCPFGKKVVSDSSQSGCLSVLANIIWIIFGGLEVALTHIIMGALLYISIIGIPWGRQHFKLLEISLMPFGKRVVTQS
nr:YccF domain-containing protein [uncultured Lacibacter sp.]